MATEAARLNIPAIRSAGPRSAATRVDPSSLEEHRPSIGELVHSASQDMSALVRNEIELAKAELKDDVKAGVRGGAALGVAAFLGLLASVLLSIALAEFLVWLGLNRALSYLIVGVVYLLVAGLAGFLGVRALSKIKAPERTIATTKESVATLKGAATS